MANSGMTETPPATRMREPEKSHFPLTLRANQSRGCAFALSEAHASCTRCCFLVSDALPAGRRRRSSHHRDTGACASACTCASAEPNPRSRSKAGVNFLRGKGFLVGRSDAGELAISAYALVRYLNQMPEQRHVRRSSRQRTQRRRAQRHFPASRDRVVQGMARPSATRLQHRGLDGEHHEPGRRSSATSATSSVASFRVYGGINGNPGTAFAAGLTSVLARPRSRDGR